MKIAVHDADGTLFPNLALMKISAFHKQKGDEVEFFRPGAQYDKIYSSQVFTFSKNPPSGGGEWVYGGTGSGNNNVLDDQIEHICPDYDLYSSPYSQGFLTRGCPNACPWCVVPEKEGEISPHADIEEFARHKEVVLMDNNVLAHAHGVEQIEKIARLGLKVDFNQGLDSRLIDDGIARRLSRLKWFRPLRLACDSEAQMKEVQKAVRLLRYHNCTPTRFFVYVLVREIPSALERVKFLKGLHLDPFAQPYRNPSGEEPEPSLKDFARWVNMKATFKSTTWEEYKKRT